MIVKDFDDMRIGTIPLSKLYYGHDLIWKREDEEKKEIVWTNRAYYGADSHDLKGVAYGNDRYVAVGGYRIRYTGSPPVTAVSINSTSWNFTNITDITPVTTFQDVAYGDGVFLATYEYGVRNPTDTRIYSSTNGTEWEMVYRVRPPGTTYYQVKIAYGGGSFITYGDLSETQYSKDKGVTWNTSQFPTTAYGRVDNMIQDIQFVNNMFIAMGKITRKIGTGTWIKNCLLYSYDGGITWTIVNGTDVVETDGESIIGFTNLGNDIYISTYQQGVNRIYKANENNFINKDLWKEVSAINSNESINPIGGDGILFARFSNSYAISSDKGKTWDYFNSPPTSVIASKQIRFLNGKFIAVGNFGRIVVGEIITVSN